MKIFDKKLNEIKPYEKNPRFNDNSVDAVANSIEEFGFKVPIVIDKDGVIVTGHTRYKAAKKLKMETVPCIVADDLTEEQIKAFRLADNRVAEFSTWDLATLNDELKDINDLDMELFGFIEQSNINLNDFFMNKEEDKKETKKEVKKIKCPHCGKEFEITEEMLK